MSEQSIAAIWWLFGAVVTVYATGQIAGELFALLAFGLIILIDGQFRKARS